MSETNEKQDFYVVGVGASAGGLDALEKFFSHTPADNGLAIVIIQHLSPDYKSLMADLLAKRTDMPVHVAEDNMPIEPNNVYLIPPRQSLTTFHRKLFLTERETGQLYLPIDIFFQSLADDLGEKAIGVILSGTGSDGTRGIRAIKEKGGLVIVQDEQSAKFDGMPRSAIATNLVDYILPPEQMVREVLNYVQHPCLVSDPSIKRAIVQDDDNLNKVFALLRSSSGVDFTYYKQNTMVRRIERRMSIKQMEKLSDYLHYLYQSPSEVNTLYREFLIGVTRFFRDPEAFDYIRRNVIPSVFANKKRGDPIRIWVAGSSTGEEAYSLAILLTEYMETSGRHMDVKVFATDLDKNALEIAGKGIYPESIAADVSTDHLQNYFIKSGDSYTVSRRIREMVIFAQQNIITDPPFSKVDIISCRNVLIYLQPVLQKKVITAFQFALNPNGYLILGTSETVGDSEDYFQCMDVKLKIHQYKGGFRPSVSDNRLIRAPGMIQHTTTRNPSGLREDWRALDNIQRGMLEAFLPPMAVVDENLNLIYTVGDMDAYLRVPSGGIFTANIIKQAREGLAIPLSTAIHKVLNDQEPVIYKNIHIGAGPSFLMIDMLAKPFFDQGTRQKLAFIEFSPVTQTQNTTSEPQTYDVASSAQQRIQDLEHELQYTRESLQATVEELETSNEELQATNEELFAANEELQSTNEELHSVNEELITVNAEYHAKIQELTRLNEDINNLLSSTEVGTLFLDMELRIRLFTPAAQKEFHLLDQDLGRPLRYVTHDFINCDLISEARLVLKTLTPRELEVQDVTNRWYQMRLTPYYTLQQQVGGVVITFMDITALKTANNQLARLSWAVEQSAQLNIITRLDGGIEYTNPRVAEATGFSAEEMLGKSWQMLFSSEKVEVLSTMKNALLQRNTWRGEVRYFRKDGTAVWCIAALSPIKNANGEIMAILFAIDDISDLKHSEEALQESERKLRLLFENMTVGFALHEMIYDATGKPVDYRFLEMNPAFEKLTGMSAARLLGKTVKESMPDIEQYWIDVYGKVASTGQPIAYQNYARELDKYFDIWSFCPRKGQFAVIFNDITPRKQAENALQMSLQKYQVLFDVFPYGISVADKQGHLLESNLEAERILGLSKEAQAQRTIDGQEWKIIRPDGELMQPNEYASVRALKENRKVEDVRMGVVKPGEQVVWINVTAVPLGDEGVIITYHEINVEEKPTTKPKSSSTNRG